MIDVKVLLTFLQERHRKSSTAPVFSIQACSVTIQSRPLARYVYFSNLSLARILVMVPRSLTAPPKKIAPPDEPFPYPDPVLVGGDHTFNIRLAEMAGLQRETAKLEECRIRIARRNAAANTAGANASTQNSTASSSLQPNNPHQPGVWSSNGGANSAAQSVRPSSGVTRVSSRTGLSRKTSLPAGYTATAVQPPPQLPPPSSLPGLSQTTKDCPPVVKRTSSPLSSISECKRSSNSDESANPCPSPTDPTNKTPEKMSADTTGQKTDNSFREKDTVQKETVENRGAIEGNVNEGIEEVGAVEIKEVVPSSHHRDLVEAIFSQTPKQKQSPNVVTDESCTQPTCSAGVSVVGDSNSKVEPSTTGRSTHTRPSSAGPNTPKSKTTTQHTPSPTKPLQETLSPSPSTPVSPTSKTSPPSSASSSSITSEHSPRPASGSSGKKPHKSSRNRKSHKKSHGRHKNT